MRRHRLSHDSRNFHEHSPRKKRTYAAAPGYFDPSIYHAQHSTRTQRWRGPDGPKKASWLYPQPMKPISGAGEPELIRADMPTKHFFVLIKLSID